MIKLNNITKIFTLPDKKLTALDNVSLHVPKGRFVVSLVLLAQVKVHLSVV